MSTTRDEQAVVRANRAFYDAFEGLDLRAMEGVWSHGEHVRCAHPGWEPLEGWEAVRESWDGIFTNTTFVRFTLTRLSTRVHGDSAWVTCFENIYTRSPGGVTAGPLLATNLFEREGGRWKMVHHHSSPVPAASPLLVAEDDSAPPADDTVN